MALKIESTATKLKGWNGWKSDFEFVPQQKLASSFWDKMIELGTWTGTGPRTGTEKHSEAAPAACFYSLWSRFSSFPVDCTHSASVRSAGCYWFLHRTRTQYSLPTVLVSLAELLTSLIYEWYGVMQKIAQTKQCTHIVQYDINVDGTCLGLGGVPSNRLWSDKWIDFRGRGQTIHESIGGTEAEVFYTTAWYQSYPPHSVFAISSVHWQCPLVVSCQSGGSCPAMSGTWCASDISTNCPSLTIGRHSGLICLAEVKLQSLCGFFVCLLSLERTDVELFPLGVSANSEQCIWLICVTWVLSSDLVKAFSKWDGDLHGVPNPLAPLQASEAGNPSNGDPV